MVILLVKEMRKEHRKLCYVFGIATLQIRVFASLVQRLARASASVLI